MQWDAKTDESDVEEVVSSVMSSGLAVRSAVVSYSLYLDHLDVFDIKLNFKEPKTEIHQFTQNYTKAEKHD